MSDVPFEMTRAELEAMLEKYREVKHDINNSLAVILALSELAQRNPAHYEKLGKAVLDRGPKMVQMLQEFQMLLVTKLKGDAAPPPDSPTSGVF